MTPGGPISREQAGLFARWRVVQGHADDGFTETSEDDRIVQQFGGRAAGGTNLG